MINSAGVNFNLFFIGVLVMVAFFLKINILLVLCVYLVLLTLFYFITPYRGNDFSFKMFLNIYSSRSLVDSIFIDNNYYNGDLLMPFNAIWICSLSLGFSHSIQSYLLTTSSTSEQQLGGFVKKLLKNVR